MLLMRKTFRMWTSITEGVTMQTRFDVITQLAVALTRLGPGWHEDTNPLHQPQCMTALTRY